MTQDDPGNFCHAGFLSVARKMVKPVSQRLRQLLEDDPSRRSYSLLITGHSAGGAIAALLYSHMLATTPAASSELSALTGCFRRVHCITFGTPPVSLLPLEKPAGRPELEKSLFLTFVNEGDPVARADKAYVRSLVDLYTSPAPGLERQGQCVAGTARDEAALISYAAAENKNRTPENKKSNKAYAPTSRSHGRPTGKQSKSTGARKTKPPLGPVWKVPPATLSSAGRIVVLRSGDSKSGCKGKETVEERLDEGVVAQIVTDEQLREVIWGDPVCHVMQLYAGRVQVLACAAVTGQG